MIRKISASYMMYRGGSWFNNADYCKIIKKDYYIKDDGNDEGLGFRILRRING